MKFKSYENEIFSQTRVRLNPSGSAPAEERAII